MTDRKLEEILDIRRSWSRNSMTSIGKKFKIHIKEMIWFCDKRFEGT